MNNPITRDVFDTRDLIEYRDELRQEVLEAYMDWAEDHNNHCDEGDELEVPLTYDEIEYVDEEAFTMTCQDLVDNLEEIEDFCNELADYAPDFEYGSTVIHEDYFDVYARELVEEVGDIPKDLPAYIENNIDWGGVADDLKVDYTEVMYDSQTFFVR